MESRELKNSRDNKETPIFVVFSVNPNEGGSLLNNRLDEEPSFSPTKIFADKDNSFNSYAVNIEDNKILLVDTPALNAESISSFNKFFFNQIDNRPLAGFIFLHDYGRVNAEGNKLFSRVSQVAETLGVPLIITLSNSNAEDKTAEGWIKYLPQWKYNEIILAGQTLTREENVKELSETGIQRRRNLFQNRHHIFLEILKKYASCSNKLSIQEDVFPDKFLVEDILEELDYQKTIVETSALTKNGIFNHSPDKEKKQEAPPSHSNYCIIS